MRKERAAKSGFASRKCFTLREHDAEVVTFYRIQLIIRNKGNEKSAKDCWSCGAEEHDNLHNIRLRRLNWCDKFLAKFLMSIKHWMTLWLITSVPHESRVFNYKAKEAKVNKKATESKFYCTFWWFVEAHFVVIESFMSHSTVDWLHQQFSFVCCSNYRSNCEKQVNKFFLEVKLSWRF